MNIAFSNQIPPQLTERAAQEQNSYEYANGVACNYTPFYFVAKEQDVITGLVSGYTCYAEVYIDDIVVFSAYRKKGIGTALLNAVQVHFAQGGFHNINLVTNAFQAPAFYEKCGFTLEFTRHNTQNPLLTKYFYIKLFK